MRKRNQRKKQGQGRKSAVCEVCRNELSKHPQYPAIECRKCEKQMHRECYQPQMKNTKDFMCDGCVKDTKEGCYICGAHNGVLKRVGESFIHVLCALISPRVQVTSYRELQFKLRLARKQKQTKCFICERSSTDNIRCCGKDCTKVAHINCLLVSNFAQEEQCYLLYQLFMKNKGSLLSYLPTEKWVGQQFLKQNECQIFYWVCDIHCVDDSVWCHCNRTLSDSLIVECSKCGGWSHTPECMVVNSIKGNVVCNGCTNNDITKRASSLPQMITLAIEIEKSQLFNKQNLSFLDAFPFRPSERMLKAAEKRQFQEIESFYLQKYIEGEVKKINEINNTYLRQMHKANKQQKNKKQRILSALYCLIKRKPFQFENINKRIEELKSCLSLLTNNKKDFQWQSLQIQNKIKDIIQEQIFPYSKSLNLILSSIKELKNKLSCTNIKPLKQIAVELKQFTSVIKQFISQQLLRQFSHKSINNSCYQFYKLILTSNMTSFEIEQLLQSIQKVLAYREKKYLPNQLYNELISKGANASLIYSLLKQYQIVRQIKEDSFKQEQRKSIDNNNINSRRCMHKKNSESFKKSNKNFAERLHIKNTVIQEMKLLRNNQQESQEQIGLIDNFIKQFQQSQQIIVINKQKDIQLSPSLIQLSDYIDNLYKKILNIQEQKTAAELINNLLEQLKQVCVQLPIEHIQKINKIAECANLSFPLYVGLQQKYKKWKNMVQKQLKKYSVLLQHSSSTQNLHLKITHLLNALPREINMEIQANKLRLLLVWCDISLRYFSENRPTIKGIFQLKNIADKVSYPNNKVFQQISFLKEEAAEFHMQINKFMEKSKQTVQSMQIYEELKHNQSKMKEKQARILIKKFQKSRLNIGNQLEELEEQLANYELLKKNFHNFTSHEQICKLRKCIFESSFQWQDKPKYYDIIRKVYEIKCSEENLCINKKEYTKMLNLGGVSAISLFNDTQPLHLAYKELDKLSFQYLNMKPRDNISIQILKEGLAKDPVQLAAVQKVLLTAFKLKEKYTKLIVNKAHFSQYNNLEKELLRLPFCNSQLLAQINFIKKQHDQLLNKIKNKCVYTDEGSQLILERYKQLPIRSENLDRFISIAKLYKEVENTQINVENYSVFSDKWNKFLEVQQCPVMEESRKKAFLNIYDIMTKSQINMPLIRRVLIKEGCYLARNNLQQYIGYLLYINNLIYQTEKNPQQSKIKKQNYINIVNIDE